MMDRNIDEIIRQLTLEEKASLCSGLDRWRTKPIPRMGIPSITMSDGPHGLRVIDPDTNSPTPHPATCFPPAVNLASSWNRELLHRVGIALGEESQAESVGVLLGPGINIKRTPLGGRNFEFFSEDPYLSAALATEYITGVQSQGVGTSLKHFAANNQEWRRLSVDVIADEQTLQEIYLSAFDRVVHTAKPWTVMCSYNRVNGTYASENSWLLTDILRDAWEYPGVVVSDWEAVDERDHALAAGLDLEMPASGGIGDQKIVDALRRHEISEDVLNESVKRLLTLIFRIQSLSKPSYHFDAASHHQLARDAAAEGITLLKNDQQALPLSPNMRIAIIGALAQTPQIQGGGSARVNPMQVDNPLEALSKLVADTGEIAYEPGYDLKSAQPNPEMIARAASQARMSDAAVIFAGLTEGMESESYDRSTMDLPAAHGALIRAVAQTKTKTIVVLSNGSPVTMPWIADVAAVIETHLGGEAVGSAIASILLGDENPSGKLAETYPLALEQNPSYLNYPGHDNEMLYREGLYVGYRYYDAKQISPLFPFGFGLSYTTFRYCAINADRTELSGDETLTIGVTIKNTGRVAGKEVVQLYVAPPGTHSFRPIRELKGFEKVALAPGQKSTMTFALKRSDFSYYRTAKQDWHVEPGLYEIQVGSSSRDILLTTPIHILAAEPEWHPPFTRNSLIGDVLTHPAAASKALTYLAKFPVKGAGNQTLADLVQQSRVPTRPLRSLLYRGAAFTRSSLEELLALLNA